MNLLWYIIKNTIVCLGAECCRELVFLIYRNLHHSAPKYTMMRDQTTTVDISIQKKGTTRDR